MKFIIGQKNKMTQIYQNEKIVPVTEIKINPCAITDVKTNEKDGYCAIQIATGNKKKTTKPQQGHFKKSNSVPMRFLREFRVSDTEINKFPMGNIIDIESFVAGDTIKVSSTSKGRGFQGVVKRHGFHGQKTTHGTKDQVRMPGSIGATGPAHVFKGMRMPGRMGGDKVTVANLEIVEVDKKNNIIKVKGAVPGHTNSLVAIWGEGEGKTLEQEKKKEIDDQKPKQEFEAEDKTETTNDNAPKKIAEDKKEKSQ